MSSSVSSNVRTARRKPVASSPDTALTASPATFGCTLALPTPRSFAIGAAALIVGVILLCGMEGVLRFAGMPELARSVMHVFWVGGEGNVPTFLNFALLVCASALLSLIAVRAMAERAAWRWHWLILGAIFLLLAFDEAASLHEMLGRFGHLVVRPEGVFRFAWVVFALPAVAVFGLAYLRFLSGLPRATARLMVIAGCTYVGGAVGAEMVNSAIADAADGERTMAYALFTMIEEAMEMAGVAILCVAALTHLSRPAHAGT